ncbi:MAG: alpha/beta fold hydrolase [Alphaproteobacteria bacterium]|nr:alpha/beta fold hydrolase [Alphaproteobacteria bacterium]
MKAIRHLAGACVLGLALGLGAAAAAEPVKTTVTIWSEGTRLAGDLYKPADLQPGEKRPGIVLVNGFPGTKNGMARLGYAQTFAEAGYITLFFDFRGWGESESYYYTLEDPAEPDAEGNVTLKARAVRTVNDPIDRLADVQSALDWLAGEPGVDSERLGLWGTSFGGGNVLYVGSRDPRVKAIVAQVPYMGAYDSPPEVIAHVQAQASRKARGEIDPHAANTDLEQGANGPSGARDLARYRFYEPLEMAKRSDTPTLIIDAKDEELFDRMINGNAAHEILKANGVPTEYRVVEGTHYAIYRAEAHKNATQWALDWFNTHLK